ncbi:GntR family transcriptional regulator [Listeria fleischmannii]|uniref:GntR family transcriptional regulator n=1 Tax=Listeria fleischmannii TaxID=1069827 RepID=A0A841YDX1_9LIST|nr:GntR family transcriptional regulator [Listeria fleischmannii]EIA19961.1 GntR family transcriptional regulator [Listeria fleischmannii subsp. coloradonensis]MBC1398414.1 GntR family transcriptional regulator [Listeria fleischmannii]MBC1426475.1 GntR family transcriptional regulator [Listeria fleischmannii]STY46611.1 HTH-type transcriptional regulator frlR [Listeria fleischmannii subsp. coloradonensis]
MVEPKYMMIINDLKQQITDGVFQPGEKIYSEGELKKKYNVSNTTVVRALQELVRAGLLTRFQGKGTFVSKSVQNKEVLFNEYNSFPNYKDTNFMRDKKLHEEFTKVVSIEEITDARIAERLQIQPENRIVHFKRVRMFGDTPWAIQNNYIAKSNLLNIDFTDLNRFITLSEELKKLYGFDILNEAMKEKIQIEFPISNPEVAELLGVPVNSPVYRMERITYIPENQPFEYVESFVKHDFYYIEIQKKKD